nr:MAG TPA: hypothetical protein [Caudoviricetes sp.]
MLYLKNFLFINFLFQALLNIPNIFGVPRGEYFYFIENIENTIKH